MIKDNYGVQELVYVTITGFVAQKSSISIKFTHMSGQCADHCVSLDKQNYTNCYNDLDMGATYVIVTEHTGPHRWIWRKARLCTKKQATTLKKMIGVTPTVEKMIEGMKWLTDVQKSKHEKRMSVVDAMLEF